MSLIALAGRGEVLWMSSEVVLSLLAAIYSALVAFDALCARSRRGSRVAHGAGNDLTVGMYPFHQTRFVVHDGPDVGPNLTIATDCHKIKLATIMLT